MPSPSVLVLGDINLDVVFKLRSYPAEGDEVVARSSHMRLGGSGCNTAVTLARLGAHSTLAGHIGQDPFARVVLEALDKTGVNLSLVQQVPVLRTGFMIIALTRGGRRTMFGERGANALPVNPAALAPALEQSPCLHVSGYTFLGDASYAAACEAIRMAKNLGKLVSLDPSVEAARNARERLHDVLPQVELLLLSEAEALEYSRESSIDASLARLFADGARRIALKRGAAGSRLVTPRRQVEAPAFHPREYNRDHSRAVVDTTGAGDAFNAGFLYAFLSGLPDLAALTLGNAVAFLCVTSPEGVSSLPARPYLYPRIHDLFQAEPLPDATLQEAILSLLVG